MAKYSKEIKFEAIRLYRSGLGGDTVVKNLDIAKAETILR